MPVAGSEVVPPHRVAVGGQQRPCERDERRHRVGELPRSEQRPARGDERHQPLLEIDLARVGGGQRHFNPAALARIAGDGRDATDALLLVANRHDRHRHLRQPAVLAQAQRLVAADMFAAASTGDDVVFFSAVIGRTISTRGWLTLHTCGRRSFGRVVQVRMMPFRSSTTIASSAASNGGALPTRRTSPGHIDAAFYRRR